MRRVYDDLATFYADDPRRERSPEHDYGVWWRDAEDFPVWRVTWVEETGEVYTIRLQDGGAYTAGPGTIGVTAGDPTGRVEVLGVIASEETDLDHAEQGVEALEGWAERCGERDSLGWVRARVAAADQHSQGGETP